MTARDPVLVHALDAQSPTSPSSHRRRSLSTASSRSLSSKRSPSPRVTFTAAPLSAEPKGVKNITRKVIKTLEGLGHLDSVDMEEQEGEFEDRSDLQEVERVLNGFAHQEQPPNLWVVTSTANGSASTIKRAPSPKGKEIQRTQIREEQKKINWEIPRKVLHSSIGFFTLYLYLSEGNVKHVILVLWTALAVILPADFLRFRYPRFERTYEKCLGFLMRESEKENINGVVWYILGVNFALTFYPLDVATVAILILSWADTAASTIGRMFGSRTPRLPARVPLLRIPFAQRKSLAGFAAATVTGACIAASFWTWVAPFRRDPSEVTWRWETGVATTSPSASDWFGRGMGLRAAAGWLGLGAITVVAGLVSGVAEAIDLGSLDDNLTLPIISGGCILGFLKLLGFFST